MNQGVYEIKQKKTLTVIMIAKIFQLIVKSLFLSLQSQKYFESVVFIL